MISQTSPFFSYFPQTTTGIQCHPRILDEEGKLKGLSRLPRWWQCEDDNPGNTTRIWKSWYNLNPALDLTNPCILTCSIDTEKQLSWRWRMCWEPLSMVNTVKWLKQFYLSFFFFLKGNACKENLPVTARLPLQFGLYTQQGLWWLETTGFSYFSWSTLPLPPPAASPLGGFLLAENALASSLVWYVHKWIFHTSLFPSGAHKQQADRHYRRACNSGPIILWQQVENKAASAGCRIIA